MLNFDVTRTISGLTVIGNLVRRVVVLASWSRLCLSVAQFMKDKSKALRDFGDISSSNGLLFS